MNSDEIMAWFEKKESIKFIAEMTTNIIDQIYTDLEDILKKRESVN